MSTVTNASLFRRSAGWLIVIAYLMAVPGVGPCALGLVAFVGGEHSHDVQFAGVENHFDLILHHSHEEATESTIPLDDPPSVAFADDDDHGDHVFQFNSLSPAKPNAGAKLLAAQASLTAITWSETPRAAVWDQKRFGRLPRGQPPPAGSALAARLRTTVILV
jgi:hypothetical protein